MKSWLSISPRHDFSIYNIPFGIFSDSSHSLKRAGAALGDYIVDLNALYQHGFFSDISAISQNVFEKNSLNEFLGLGNETCEKVRKKIQSLFSVHNSALKEKSDLHSKILISSAHAQNFLPIKIGDYVDFYSSLAHATNVGKMFRDETNPLLPNWKYIPIGYHGRASSIVTSGTKVIRPKGQLKKSETAPPIYGPSEQLDFELEVAFITNKKSHVGNTLTPLQASEHIFGLTLFNDWSARDIQRWEYVPLGPFLGKSFASTMSPWIVSLEALKPFAIPSPIKKDIPELEYLVCPINGHYDIHLEVYLKPNNSSEEFLICRSNYKNLYWNLYQQLAHLSSNGSPINIGDVCASGTISGDDPSSFGSLLELSWNGKKPLQLPNGELRKFINDGDTIIMKGYAEDGDMRVGFGEACGMLIPSSTKI